MPFPIRQVQTDNGNKFSLAFRLTVQEAGIELHPAPRPQHNGKVERSHRIDTEEFWSRRRLRSLGEAETALRSWEHHYNAERFSIALRSENRVERLATKLAT